MEGYSRLWQSYKNVCNNKAKKSNLDFEVKFNGS